MQNGNFKKIMAGMLTTMMVLGMTATVFAEEASSTGGSVDGSGTFEGHVDKDVVSVTLPTAAATTFAYTMDPEGLIAATEGKKYPDATFEEDANVYFLSAENTYTKESAKLKVVNKGAVDVNVTVKASVPSDGKVTMSETNTFTDANDKVAKLYLGLNVTGQAEQDITTTADDSKITVGLKGKADNYEVTYNGSKYTYSIKDGTPETAWNSLEFWLTGACNPYGNYGAEDMKASDVTVTWSYEKRPSEDSNPYVDENATTAKAPFIATTNYEMTASTPVEIPVDFGSGNLAATSVAHVYWNSTDVLGSTVTYTEGKLTLAAASVNYFISHPSEAMLKVVFDDTAATEVEITLTQAGN